MAAVDMFPPGCDSQKALALTTGQGICPSSPAAIHMPDTPVEPEAGPSTQPAATQTSVGIALPSLAPGSLSVVCTAVVLLAAIFRADPKDIPKIIEGALGSNVFAAIGWTLAVVFLAVGSACVFFLSRIYNREIARISAERDTLQNRLLQQR